MTDLLWDPCYRVSLVRAVESDGPCRVARSESEGKEWTDRGDVKRSKSRISLPSSSKRKESLSDICSQ